MKNAKYNQKGVLIVNFSVVKIVNIVKMNFAYNVKIHLLFGMDNVFKQINK